MELTIDFSSILSMEQFYEQLKKQVELPAHFGNNLDALHDVITGELPLPASWSFTNIGLNKLERFEELFDMLEETSDETDNFSFVYSITD